jgi:hypothetical protein
MFGMRCEECGEVRWSIFAPAEEHPKPECPVCGTEMTIERRHPGHRTPSAQAERRDEPTPA